MQLQQTGGDDIAIDAAVLAKLGVMPRKPPLRSELERAPAPDLVRIAFPMFLELCLGVSVAFLGTALAAKHSDATAAAFSVTNQVAATLFILFRVIGAGISVVVSQAIGGGRRDTADGLAKACIGASVWGGGVVAVIAMVAAPTLLHSVYAPEAIAQIAVPFLRALAPALLLDALNASMSSVLRAHLRVRESLVVIVVMQVCHVALAVPFTSAWGLPGFAIGLGLSRALGLGLHLWLWRTRLEIKLSASDVWRLPRDPVFAILRIGLPGAAENIAYRLAFMASVVVAGQLGETALATQAYVLQFQHAVLLFGLATGLAVEIVVGHLVGAGAFGQAHRLVRNALAAGIVVSFCLSLLVALFGGHLLGIFSSDPKLVAAGVALLWWAVLLEPGRTFNLVVINALRATGDARYPVLAGAASMLVILAGGSWWLGIHLGWGLTGVWVAYAVDEWVRGLLMWARWAGQGWLPFARNSRRRLRTPVIET